MGSTLAGTTWTVARLVARPFMRDRGPGMPMQPLAGVARRVYILASRRVGSRIDIEAEPWRHSNSFSSTRA